MALEPTNITYNIPASTTATAADSANGETPKLSQSDNTDSPRVERHTTNVDSRRDRVAAAAEPHFSAGDDNSDDTCSVVSDLSDAEDRQAYLAGVLSANDIPLSSESIDLSKLKGGEPLQKCVLDMLHELLPSSWGHVSDHKSLKLERVSGAMTNCIFFVSGPAESDSAKPPKVLLRIYGAAAGNFIKRDREMFWLCKMGSSGVAPKLLAAFENGRFEQYLDSVTLTKDDIRDPETSRQIAVGLFKLHQLLQNCDGEEEATADPDLFGKMRRWHKLALRAAQECKESHPQRYLELRNVVNVRTLAAEIDELEEKLLKINSPPVFAHNDLQYGNILRKVKDGSIVIVDYEYSSINYRGYDFGNHFCEWAADYHSDASHEMHFDRYPTQAEQDNFLSAYIDAQVEAKEIEKPSEAQRQEILKDMRREANQFSLCSNLLWGLWGIMQSGETNIDFDYLGYGSQRFREYFRVKDQYLNL